MKTEHAEKRRGNTPLEQDIFTLSVMWSNPSSPMAAAADRSCITCQSSLTVLSRATCFLPRPTRYSLLAKANTQSASPDAEDSNQSKASVHSLCYLSNTCTWTTSCSLHAHCTLLRGSGSISPGRLSLYLYNCYLCVYWSGYRLITYQSRIWLCSGFKSRYSFDNWFC